MDKKIIDAFKFLAEAAKISKYDEEKLIDIICDHDYKLHKSSSGYSWYRCTICDKNINN